MQLPLLIQTAQWSRLVVFLYALTSVLGCRSDALQYSTSEAQTANSAPATSAVHGLDVATGWSSRIELFTESKLNDDSVEATIGAIESWNDAVGYDLLGYAGSLVHNRGNELFASLDDGMTVIYGESAWKDTTGKNSQTLATTVWEQDGDSGAIFRGDIILNTESYEFVDVINFIYNGSKDMENWQLVADAQTVIVHEIGHLIGLGHVDEHIDAESVMHARTQVGPDNHLREPSLGDQNLARLLYVSDEE